MWKIYLNFITDIFINYYPLIQIFMSLILYLDISLSLAYSFMENFLLILLKVIHYYSNNPWTHRNFFFDRNFIIFLRSLFWTINEYSSKTDCWSGNTVAENGIYILKALNNEIFWMKLGITNYLFFQFPEIKAFF